MRLELTGRHIDITPRLRRLVDSKLARLDRLLSDSALSAQVVLSREKLGSRADVTLHARGEKFLHGVGKGIDVSSSMTAAIAKLVQQAQRVKGKWLEPKRRARDSVRLVSAWQEAAQPTSDGPAARAAQLKPRMPQILRATRQAIKPMSVADAARQLDASNGLVVFRDIETSAIAVVYRARTGEITLVEAE